MSENYEVDDFEISPELCNLIHKILAPDEAQQKSDILFGLDVQMPNNPEFYLDILPDFKEEIRAEVEDALNEDTVMELISRMEAFWVKIRTGRAIDFETTCSFLFSNA